MMKINAYAKINLNLRITGKRSDGYHTLDTMMHGIPLCDVVSAELSDGKITISCSNPLIPCDGKNIVYKVIAAYFEKYGISSGISVNIEKNIPLSGGFGGSSTDGAAMLLLLNEMFGKASDYELFEMAKRLSADMPFCLMLAKVCRDGYEPYCARCTGIGDEIEEVSSPIIGAHIVIASKGQGLDTKEMYAEFDSASNNDCKCRARVNEVELYNDFEEIAIAKRREISIIKEITEASGGVSLMTGSGNGVFAIFPDKKEAEASLCALRTLGINAFMFTI